VDKIQLRATLKSFLRVPAETGLVVAGHLFSWLSPRVPGSITSYRAMADEVDISSLIDRLPGWRWLLPRVEADNSLTWRDARVPLEKHPWGMEQPTDRGPIVPVHEIDVFLVPGLAFDRAGRRLGRGSGFYDRELVNRRSDSVAVGVTVESRVLEFVPTEQHDQAMRFLATESGVNASIPTT